MAREMSEIENALLDQAVQLILGEWCIHWSKVKELVAGAAGDETNGKFIQTALPETMMLVVAKRGSARRHLRGALQNRLYSSLEALIRQLTKSADTVAEAAAAARNESALQWNPACDEIQIPLVAEWQGLEKHRPRNPAPAQSRRRSPDQ